MKPPWCKRHTVLPPKNVRSRYQVQCHDIVETISMKHGEVVLFVPHLVWIRRGYGTNYSAWLEHAGFNSSKANHCGLHRLCPQLFCLRFCFACRVLYVASSVLECRIHYLDLSVVRPGGYGNLARKASVRAQRISV